MPPEIQLARALRVAIDEESLTVDLAYSSTITVPLAWYPRLMRATAMERGHWRLNGDGDGIYWPDLDEDLSVEGLLVGRMSAEGQPSLDRLLAARRQKDHPE